MVYRFSCIHTKDARVDDGIIYFTLIIIPYIQCKQTILLTRALVLRLILYRRSEKFCLCFPSRIDSYYNNTYNTYITCIVYDQDPYKRPFNLAMKAVLKYTYIYIIRV